MTDYIKREDALKSLRVMMDGTGYQDMAMGCINRLLVPSADVAPVRHGRWIEGKLPLYNWGGEEIGEKSTWKCSLCDEISFWGYNYCSHCGAKMDLED